jgi:hypothetical protein
MIDPKDFLNKDKQKSEPVVDDSIPVSGTFVCQECDETVHNARLDESKRKLVWSCSQEHYSEARL